MDVILVLCVLKLFNGMLLFFFYSLIILFLCFVMILLLNGEKVKFVGWNFLKVGSEGCFDIFYEYIFLFLLLFIIYRLFGENV